MYSDNTYVPGWKPAWTQDQWERHFDSQFANTPIGQIPTGAPPPPVDYGGPIGARSTAPQPGQGPFGKVPGPIGDVSNIAYDDMAKRLPSLPGLNQQAARGVAARMAGELSPETLAQIQDIGARFGVSSGMPGAGLAQYRTARDLGRTTEDLQRAGFQDYGSLLNTIKSTQTVSPETQIQAREQDLLNAAAPDPAQAAQHAEQLYDKYLSAMMQGQRYRGPAGGTGNQGGGGGYSAAQPGGSSVRPGGAATTQQQTPAPGGGTGESSSRWDWYNPLASDEDQYNMLFPNDYPTNWDWSNGQSTVAPAGPSLYFPHQTSNGEQYRPTDNEFSSGAVYQPGTGYSMPGDAGYAVDLPGISFWNDPNMYWGENGWNDAQGGQW